MSDEGQYDFVSNEAAKKESSDPLEYALVKSDDAIKGEFSGVKSGSDFITVEGELSENKEQYALKVGYNKNFAQTMKQRKGLSDRQTVVLDAYSKVALGAEDEKQGKGIFSALIAQDANLAQIANDQTLNEFVNGGAVQAALTINRKVNENISRRLDRSRTGINTGDMFESEGFWGQYFYSDGSMDNKNGNPGFDSKVNGITLGIDADINDMLTAGFAFSYANSKLNNKGVSGESKNDSYMGTVYGGWHRGDWFADGMLSYAGAKADLQRDTYKADSVSNSTWGARAVAGYVHQVNQWVVQPQGEFNYVSLKMDDFTEKGTGDTGQSVKVDDYSVMELGAGLKVFGEFDAGRGVIKPEATLDGLS